MIFFLSHSLSLSLSVLFGNMQCLVSLVEKRSKVTKHEMCMRVSGFYQYMLQTDGRMDQRTDHPSYKGWCEDRRGWMVKRQ